MTGYQTASEKRRAALHGLLIRLGYGRLNVLTVLAHLDNHGSVATCQNVRTDHRRIVGDLIARHDRAQCPAEVWEGGGR